MTEMATIDWFGRWGTSVFSENIAFGCQDFSGFSSNICFSIYFI